MTEAGMVKSQGDKSATNLSAFMVSPIVPVSAMLRAIVAKLKIAPPKKV